MASLKGGKMRYQCSLFMTIVRGHYLCSWSSLNGTDPCTREGHDGKRMKTMPWYKGKKKKKKKRGSNEMRRTTTTNQTSGYGKLLCPG